MRGFYRPTVGLAAAVLLLAGSAVFAQTPVPPGSVPSGPAGSPVCQRLEGQLASLDRGNADPARADQIRRAEDALNRQQFEVDKLVSHARRMDCERSGFFSIFREPPPQCGALNRGIDQARNTLDRMQNQLEQLQGGTTQRAAQRQSLLISLGDNNCGPQYRSAAQQGQQGGFFDRLFGLRGNEGGVIVSPEQQQPMAGTYRTVCVRTCDGYYFPISFATTPDRFATDAQACQRLCPAAQVSLYTYHNPGEDMSHAVSLEGQQYSALPSAFAYRKALNPACSCRHPGESWSEALRSLGPDATVEPGDVVVTEQNAKRLSQPRTGPDGKPLKPEAQAQVQLPPAAALGEAPGTQVDPAKRTVRTVGPTFLPSH